MESGAQKLPKETNKGTLDDILSRIQAMGNVGERPLRDFSGGLDPHKASKGVFITTSRFTPEAYEYVKKIGKTIVLIDGAKLAQLMFEHGIGVTEVDSFSVKKADLDYFEGEQ